MVPRSSTPPTTRDRILDASRLIFNQRGYAATTQAEIAAEVGISQGNLTYHFPTKAELVAHLEDEARERIRARRAALRTGAIADDYVEHLLFAMSLTRDYRFLLRDRAQFGDDRKAPEPDPEMAADFEELHGLLRRIDKDGLFRRDLRIDLEVLARSLWIVSRYWLDYLAESESLSQVTWADQERGIQHHFAVLLPSLTASARRDFEAALVHASSRLAVKDEAE